VSLTLNVDYPNALNGTEKATEENKFKGSSASALNVSVSQVAVALGQTAGPRKILGIKYDVRIVVSGLSIEIANSIVAQVNQGNFVESIESAVGQNITVIWGPVINYSPGPTQAVSKAMTKAVFMYWNIMVVLLAFY